MANIPQKYLLNVVAIGNADSSAWQEMATGFIYGVSVGKSGGFDTFLVTAKHVLVDKERNPLSKIKIRINPVENSAAREVTVELFQDDQQIWTENGLVDVAVMRINLNQLTREGLMFSMNYLDEHLYSLKSLEEEGVSEGDAIFTIGFPSGLGESERVYPLVRTGTIARIRDLYEEKVDSFIIDATVYPGASGSPVFYKPETAHPAFLLGIVSEYIPYVENAVSEHDGKILLRLRENSGFTRVYPSYFIETLVKHHQQKWGIPQLPEIFTGRENT